jgi:hypothetical protein
MEIIVLMRFGAHLYGKATAESDLDLKAVSRPEARDILLQRACAARSTDSSGGRPKRPKRI